MKGKAALFIAVCRAHGLPEPEAEHKFHPERRWRADFAFLESKIIVEVEGGVFSGGRHTRGAGFCADMEKYNAAAALGWTVLRCMPSTLMSKATIDLIKQVITYKNQ